nr:hypothetical protein [Tanacetum cinerariifolium]GEX81259.1 hypothetical protein [Tanacetum cinerariifolium]GEX82509.1 hypothetical protein [Tanacetum cinerariifolium]
MKWVCLLEEEKTDIRFHHTKDCHLFCHRLPKCLPYFLEPHPQREEWLKHLHKIISWVEYPAPLHKKAHLHSQSEIGTSIYRTRSGPPGTVPEETEWDCSEPFIGLGGVTLVSVGGFSNLGLLFLIESAPEASRPCDWGEVNLDNSTNNVLIPLDSWTSRLLEYKLPLNSLRVMSRLSRKNDMLIRDK